MNIESFVITGIGGQGVILLSKIVAAPPSKTASP